MTKNWHFFRFHLFRLSTIAQIHKFPTFILNDIMININNIMKDIGHSHYITKAGAEQLC